MESRVSSGLSRIQGYADQLHFLALWNDPFLGGTEMISPNKVYREMIPTSLTFLRSPDQKQDSYC